MTTSHRVLPMHAINLQNCTSYVFVRRSDVSESKESGFFTSTANSLQNPWMCASLLQQPHQGAIVTMSNLLMNLLQKNWRSPFAQMSLDPHKQQEALAVAVQMVAELAVAPTSRSTSISDVLFSFSKRCVVTGGKRNGWSLIFIRVQMLQNAQY